MMEKCLLSVDWDYFIYSGYRNFGSYVENKRTIIDLWYKRYILSKRKGEDIRRYFRLSKDFQSFWHKIKGTFGLIKGIKVYVSDSHALSYQIALDNKCNTVYLFDSHADLGYGGLESLKFEVNCGNWLGKLFIDKKIDKAHIIYSPFTLEKPHYFNFINKLYNINYPKLEDLDTGIDIDVIHIARSGAWTPPWYDEEFFKFINSLRLPYKIVDCPIRRWDPGKISFADEIYYLMA